uniref:Beta-D-glucosyl crocetin beta-1,6-glucosyltransferase n=1 Tax=Tanacetum cinerariifolium TaxID=118510 RepID=A0A6L2K9X9_TANCI|nr:beta-D-glucosyl crocetin beta-1,6-glucosyltransferase [Tanacetum cinerariifolium]
MFPWLGHGQVSPFLELAKKFINTNLFNVYLCSTPANPSLDKRAQVNESITFIELNLKPLPDLPSELHTTNGLPLHLMPSLKKLSTLEILDVAFPFDTIYYRNKRVVPVGPLVVESLDVDLEQNNVIHWLDMKTTESTVFASFGSKYFLSKADMTQTTLGLEMSSVNFDSVIRFPKGENYMTIKEALPLGFAERVKIRAMKFGVSIIAMPMYLDQPVNARLVVDIEMRKEVVRENKGVLMGAKVAEIVNEVVASNLGKNTWSNQENKCRFRD